MICFKSAVFLFTVFHFVAVEGVYTIVGCTVINKALAQLAINDAFKVAKYAADQLTQDTLLTNPVNQAAFLPLFNSGDRQRVIDVFNNIVAYQTNMMQITFFCTEDHVTLTPPDSHTAPWMDTAFVNNANKQPIAPGASIPQDSKYMALAPRPKPGDRGSYSILGFNSATIGADFSSQAHIFLSPNRFGQTNPNYDQRTYDSIKTGLKPGFNFLSYIKPLGQTVLHELTHIAGGLKDPAHGSKIIRDAGPGGACYGWTKCEEAKRANNPLLPPVQICDSYVMLAQALYLQIKNTPTYWSTGAVDPDTLQPTNIPPPPAHSKRSLMSYWNEADEVGRGLVEVAKRYTEKAWVA